MLKHIFSKLNPTLPLREALGGAFFLLMASQPLAAQTDSDPFPEVNYYKYQSNMSFTGQVRINGEVQPDGTIIAVYCGDEIRGKDVVFSQGSRSNFFMVNAMGEKSGEPLHFKVYVDGRIIEVNQGVTFSADAELGNIKNFYYIDLPAPIVTTPTAEGWATTCLPFNAEVPEGVTVWNATCIADGELLMTKAAVGRNGAGGDLQSPTPILPANTPVLLHSEGLTNYEWLSRVSDGNVTLAGSIFHGTTEPTTVAAGSVLTLGYSNEGNQEIGFWRYTGTEIPANRAYIANFPAGVRGVKFNMDDETTGVSAHEASSMPKSAAIYTLDGRKVAGRASGSPANAAIEPSAHLRGGRELYVTNGRKVVIKWRTAQ